MAAVTAIVGFCDSRMHQTATASPAEPGASLGRLDDQRTARYEAKALAPGRGSEEQVNASHQGVPIPPVVLRLEPDMSVASSEAPLIGPTKAYPAPCETEEAVIEVISIGEVGVRYHEPVIVDRRRDQEIVTGTPVPICHCGRRQYKQRQQDCADNQFSIGHPGIYPIQARSYSEARHRLPLQ